MDKLKPILEQKFWIFLGLALIIPFIGWFLATSSYATGVEARETTINASFDSLNIPAETPNPEWVSGAGEIVREEQKRLDASQKDLWLKQKESMDWPPLVHGLMKDVPYESEQVDPRAQEFYSQGYFRQLGDIEAALHPFNYETGEGVLLFQGYLQGGSYTHVPYGQWSVTAPTPTEMWNAQIDLWLVRAIFESIESINQSATKITDAPVRQLIDLTLRGGDRNYSPNTGSNSESNSENMLELDSSGLSQSGSSSGREAGTNVSVRFDLSEELGPMSAGGQGPGLLGESGSSFSADTGNTDSPQDTPKGPVRYVDDDEGYPFRTRAFVLGVIMDQQDIPKFLAELSRSDWPIQIIRVQTAAYVPDQLQEAGRRGGRLGSSVPRPAGFAGRSSFANDSDGDSPFSSGSSIGRSSILRRPGGVQTPGVASRNAAGLVQQAMSDPNLSEVWIGGLITLFRPVDDAAAIEDLSSPSPGNTAGTQPTDITETTPAEPTPAITPSETPEATPPTDDPTLPASESTEGTTPPPTALPPGETEQTPPPGDNN